MAVVVLQNKYMRRFSQAGATTPERAITLKEVGIRKSLVFSIMAHRGVFVDVGDGHYYLDPQQARAFLRHRNLVALVFCIAGIIIWIAIILS